MLQYIYNKMFQEEIMKKLLSLLLAAIMLFTLGFSAVADENDDPTTYLSIMNNDYESVIMTFNVNADKFVADTATYRVFSDVCFEDVVSDDTGVGRSAPLHPLGRRGARGLRPSRALPGTASAGISVSDDAGNSFGGDAGFRRRKEMFG